LNAADKTRASMVGFWARRGARAMGFSCGTANHIHCLAAGGSSSRCLASL
jgi:hypothetical protein